MNILSFHLVTRVSAARGRAIAPPGPFMSMKSINGAINPNHGYR